MGRPKSDDPKMKINMQVKQSFILKIEEISENTGITKTGVLEICLENSIPMLEKLSEKIKGIN